jgi:hypothetical protein
MITRVQYLRLSSMLPIIAPVLLLTASVLVESLGAKLPAWVDFLVGISFSAAFMFGIPYCILIAFFLILLWERSWKAHVIAALAAPILMIPVVTIFLWILNGTDGLASGLQFAPYCLGVGYAYVAVALVGMCGLNGLKQLKDEATA